MTASSYRWDKNVPDEELLRIVRSDGDAERRRVRGERSRMPVPRDAVYLWCFRYTGDVERALDLSQDVLASVWEKIETFESRAKFSSWLFAVTRNRCIDASRHVSYLLDEDAVAAAPDRAPLPDAAFYEEQDEEWLLQTIRTELEPDEQQAIWLRCVERMGIDEVTRVMRLDNASGARTVLQRGRKKLRAALERRKHAQ
jgi:RNA polymerase sigma-70 factor (ECF subfamily)